MVATYTSDIRELSGIPIGPQLPLVDLSGPVMIFQDGSLALGFTCQAPISSLLGDDDRRNIYDGIRSAIKNLPPGVTLQIAFGQESRPSDIAPLVGIGKATYPLMQQVLKDRADGILEGIGSSLIRVTTLDFYINVPNVVPVAEIAKRVAQLERDIVSSTPTKFTGLLGQLDTRFIRPAMGALSALMSPLNGAAILALEEYTATRSLLISAGEGLKASLHQAGLSPETMTSATVLSRLYRRFNPGKFEAGLNPRKFNPDSDVPVSELFVSSPLSWDPTGVKVPKGLLYVDGYYHRVLTVRMPPERMFFPHLEGLGLFGNLKQMDIVLNITEADGMKRLSDLQNEEKAIVNNNRADVEAHKLAQIREEISELGSREERIWNAQHVFILRNKDPKALMERESRILMDLAQRSEGLELSEEVHATWLYWKAAMPGWSRESDLHRHNIYNTRQLATMVPVFGGNRLPVNKPIGAVLQTHDGSLLNIYLHDSDEMSAPNALILGRPGSGKSVLANTIMSQLGRVNPRLVIVDVGASYRRLTESMGGVFLDYDIRSSSCRINPFSCFTKRAAGPEEQQAVILLLEKMLSERGSDKQLVGFSREERSTVEQVLTGLIRKNNGREFYLRDFREALQGLDTKLGNDLSLRIDPYCNGNTYSNLFDGPTNIPTDTRVTCFELDSVNRQYPDLLPIVFQTILQHVIALSNDYPNDVKLLAIDEAHILLKDPLLRTFVELAFRTFRKLGVAVVGISQGIGDWVVGENPKAILSTIGAYYVCAQAPATADDLARICELSSNETEALKELRVVPGTLSECMAIRYTSKGRRTTICENRLTPIEYAIYTTDSEDRAVIAQWQAVNKMSITEATHHFSQRYPRGVKQAGGRKPEDLAA